MKRYIILVLLTISFKSLAQNPQLFANTWYLEKVVIGQEEFMFPYNGHNAEIQFKETFFIVSHPFCEDGFGTETQFAGDNTFTNQFGGSILLETCGFPANEYFGRHYKIYLEDDNNTPKNPFTYALTTSNNHTLLTITNADGDQAFYGDAELANSSFRQPEFSIYPNPIHDVLNLSGFVQSEILDLQVYDLFGNAMLSEEVMKRSNLNIDMSAFSNAIYFIKVRLKDGSTFNKKLVKI